MGIYLDELRGLVVCSSAARPAKHKGGPVSESFFIPTEVPWQDLKGKDLEELLYWLFDSMGAKDLEWRVGGRGAGAPDQGRDLELSFYVASPDGDLIKQRWWIEAKGRSGSVEPFEVQKAVLNAAGKASVDVIVIATNSAFSNPTRDWVKEWQSDHPRPKVKLWEKTELENLCSKNPLAVIRLFAKALNSQGKLEVVKAKLWDYASFTDEHTLSKLWKDRRELAIEPRALIALISSEMANGDINSRSWAIFVDEVTMIGALGEGLINLLYLALRANESGIRQLPLFRALACLILTALHRLGAPKTIGFLTILWGVVEGRDYPEEIKKIILQPIFHELFNEVRDVCTSDCPRVSTKRIILSAEEVELYWKRLHSSQDVVSEVPERPEHILIIENSDTPCKVGFHLDRDHSCPLCNNDCPEGNLPETLHVIGTVAKFRAQSN